MNKWGVMTGVFTLVLMGSVSPTQLVDAADSAHDFQIVATDTGNAAAVNGSINLTAGDSSVLENVPDFNFGTQSTSAVNKNYAAKSNKADDDTTDTVDAPVLGSSSSEKVSTEDATVTASSDDMQLTVRNPGRTTGWAVYVSASDFKRTTPDDNRVLQGAVLSIKKNLSTRTAITTTSGSADDRSINGNATIIASDSHQTDDEAPQSVLIAATDTATTSEANTSTLVDTASSANVEGSSSAATDDETGSTSTNDTDSLMADPSNFIIPMDSAVGASRIFWAGTDKGVGVWTLDFGTDNVRLDVPAGNVAGSYQADLTWELQNTPENGTTIAE